MMKKIVVLFLCAAMLLTFAACGNSSDNGADENNAPAMSNKKANEVFEDGMEAFIDFLFLADADALDDVVPQGIWDYYLSERNNEITVDDCATWLETNAETWLESNEDYGVGKVTDVTFEIIEATPWAEDEIENFKQWEEMYGVEMTDGYNVEVKFTIKGEDGTTTKELYQDMYKNGDDYYVYAAIINVETLTTNAYYKR